MADTETVGLDLGGDYVAKAQQAATATWSWADSLNVMEKGAEQAAQALAKINSDRLKATAQAADDAAKKMDKLRAASKAAAGGGDGAIKGSYGGGTPAALKESASNAIGSFGKVVGMVHNALGPGAAEGVVKGAGILSEAAEKLGPVSGLLKGAAGGVAAGGAVVLAAAAALAVAGAGLIAAGVKFGIETTSKREIQSEIFKKVGGSYDAAINIAAKYGIEGDAAVAEVKKLLGAKFSQAKIDALIRVSVGIGAVLGEEKAKAFLEKMTQQQNKGGKASEETIKGFAEAGVAAESVYAQLATKLGISIKAAKAKVKSGAVDMKDALDAVKDAAGKDFGGVADKLGGSIPALLNKIKLAFTQLFGGFDLGPLKSVLKNIGEVLQGPVGKGMGDAFGKLGSAIIKALFGPMSGGDGKARIENIGKVITTVVNKITAGVTAVTPYITAAVKWIGELFTPKKQGDGGVGVFKTLGNILNLVMVPARIMGAVFKPLAAPVGALIEKLGGMSAILKVLAIPAGIAATAIGWFVSSTMKAIDYASKLVDMLGLGSATSAASSGGSSIGTALTDGLLGGIASGAAAAIGAAAGLASGVLSKIKGVLGVASPSKAMMFVGDMMGDGMAKGMNDNAKPLAAGEKMAAKGAAGAAKGAGAGGAAGGGGGDTYNFFFTAPAGMDPAAAKVLGDQIGEQAYAKMQELKRREARESGKRAA